MVTHRHHLTPAERQRIAALWQTITGLRPRITVTKSKIVSRRVQVTISYAKGSGGYRGMSRHSLGWFDAPGAAARLAVSDLILPPERTLEQRHRFIDIVLRYIEAGHVTPDALADVAMIPNGHLLAVFFAQFV